MSADRIVIAGSLPASPGSRPCCLLTKRRPFPFPLLFPKQVVETNEKLEHRSGTGFWGWMFRCERSGLVYTCSAGFIDLGHLRDVADLTKYYYGWVGEKKAGRNKAGDRFPTFNYKGIVKVLKDIPTDSTDHERIQVARSMAYDESIFHEIETYWSSLPGSHHSAFSPEDLVSNYLGTYVAEQAIIAEQQNGTDFDQGATEALKNLLATQRALPKSGTKEAFDKVEGRWFNTGSVTRYPLSYLERRNFDLTPRPWRLSEVTGLTEVTGCAGTVIVAGPLAALPAGTQSYYESRFENPRRRSRTGRSRGAIYALEQIFEILPGLGTEFVSTTEFPAQIAKIKGNALDRYGSIFETP